MSDNSQDESGRGLPPGHEGAEDIEILEVVGVDEDGAPIPESDQDGDVEVVFEDGAPESNVAMGVAQPSSPSEDGQLWERILRLKADFENFRNRMERERSEHTRFATLGLVERILPVLDNFERAMAAARPGSSHEALVAGFALIQRQLLSELEAEGLRAVEGAGAIFDPALHEAVATDPDSPFPPHTVTQVFQRGYFLHDRLLRPALVRVRIDQTDDGTESDAGDRKES